MKNIFFILLSIALLLTSNAYAKKKADSEPLKASIQEAYAATLDNDDESDTVHKTKKKKATKAKKHKKAKK